MMSCREVSAAMAQGDLAGATFGQRLQIWSHLAFCGSCRAFRRQLLAIDRGLRTLAGRISDDAPADLETGIVQRVLDERPQSEG